MRRTVATIALVTCAAGLAAPALAASTRSTSAVPAAAAHAADGPTRVQGPKAAFPDNQGIDRAREVASDRARFLRNDSEG